MQPILLGVGVVRKKQDADRTRRPAFVYKVDEQAGWFPPKPPHHKSASSPNARWRAGLLLGCHDDDDDDDAMDRVSGSNLTKKLCGRGGWTFGKTLRRLREECVLACMSDAAATKTTMTRRRRRRTLLLTVKAEDSRARCIARTDRGSTRSSNALPNTPCISTHAADV
jgi:hypothetical protein